jgi:hypothetical protein
MPGAISVSYAVFEPFSKDLIGGRLNEATTVIRPASCPVFIEQQGSVRWGAKFRPSNSRSLPMAQCARAHSYILPREFPRIKFGAAVPGIEATR